MVLVRIALRIPELKMRKHVVQIDARKDKSYSQMVLVKIVLLILQLQMIPRIASPIFVMPEKS